MFSVALVGLLGDAPERQALLRMGSRRRLVTRLPGRLRSSAHGSLCWHLSLLALWCHDRHSGRAGLIHVSENSAHWGSMRPEMGRETPVLLRRQPVRLREKTQARAVSARTDEIRREGNGPGSQRGGQRFESLSSTKGFFFEPWPSERRSGSCSVGSALVASLPRVGRVGTCSRGTVV
jgi:hypothetical protein